MGGLELQARGTELMRGSAISFLFAKLNKKWS